MLICDMSCQLTIELLEGCSNHPEAEEVSSLVVPILNVPRLGGFSRCSLALQVVLLIDLLR